MANRVVAIHLDDWHMDFWLDHSMVVVQLHHHPPTSSHKWTSIGAKHSSQQHQNLEKKSKKNFLLFKKIEIKMGHVKKADQQKMFSDGEND